MVDIVLQSVYMLYVLKGKVLRRACSGIHSDGNQVMGEESLHRQKGIRIS